MCMFRKQNKNNKKKRVSENIYFYIDIWKTLNKTNLGRSNELILNLGPSVYFSCFGLERNRRTTKSLHFFKLHSYTHRNTHSHTSRTAYTKEKKQITQKSIVLLNVVVNYVPYIYKEKKTNPNPEHTKFHTYTKKKITTHIQNSSRHLLC